MRSYSSPKALGHRLVDDILGGYVVVQEKVDGSQLSFGVYDGELKIKSKNSMRRLDESGMFEKGIKYIVSIKDELKEGYTYRGEYLQKPKHNTKAYNRAPINHIIIFDVDAGNNHYLRTVGLQHEAEQIGLEAVPVLAEGRLTVEEIKELLDTESVLGGTKIEGVVIKRYDRFIRDKVMMAKYVSPDFKEKHQKDWKERNPGPVERITSEINQEAVWRKAVQHLRDDGELEHAPKDIGPLIQEIKRDVKEEQIEYIKEVLFEHYRKDIFREIVRGFPEWYKEQLLD